MLKLQERYVEATGKIYRGFRRTLETHERYVEVTTEVC